MRSFFLLLFFSFFIFIQEITFAQQPHLNVFTLPDTYEDFKISCIIRETDKFVYVGSNFGLIRFDGTEYKYYNSDSAFVKAVSCINYLNGKVFVGFEDGTVAEVYGNRLLRFIYTKSKNTYSIKQIAKAPNKDMAISTYGNGIFYLSGDSTLHITTSNGLVDNTVNAGIFNNSSELFIGTDRGLNILTIENYKIQSVKLINELNELPDNLITDLLLKEDSSIWISMHNKGVCKYYFSLNKIETYDVINKWNYGPIASISQIENEVWMATDKGIGVLGTSKEESFQLYDWKKQFSIKRITDLYKDELNNAWFVDNTNKIYFTSKQFIFIERHESVNFGKTTAIYADSKGFLWFASGDTLFQHPIVFNNNNVMRKHLAFLSKRNTGITCIYEDVNGSIWVGTFDEGLFKINPITNEIFNYNTKNGLIDNSVLSIEGNEKGVWFATLSGLTHFSFSNTISNLTKGDGLPNSFIYDLELDAEGNLWMATDGDGIIKYNGYGFEEISKKYRSNIKVAYNIIEDTNGKVWFTSANHGIGCFNKDSITIYNLSDGLSNLEITGIVSDDLGNLVICNKKGIDLLNTESGEVQNFSKAHGLYLDNSNINNICKDVNSNIWIAAENSIIKYLHHQNPIKSNISVELTGLSVFLEPVKIIGDTIFKHNQNHITISYSGFWFHDPSKIRYQHKLDGFDIDWQTSSDKFATYSNLPPGHYNFKVRASNNNLFTISSDIKSYSFQIKPALYNTNWFRFMVFLLIGILIYLYIKFRENRIQARKQLEMESVKFQLNALRSQVNPHFLFNSFNTLLGVIDEDSKKAGKFVEQLSDFFRNILNVRDDNAIPVSEELKLLNAYVFLEKERYGNNLELNINLSDEIQCTYIPPLTLQLLVENCIKHNVVSKANPLTINISNSKSHIIISNNIQPKITSPKSTGIGLSNIKQRYEIVCKEPVTISKKENNFIVNLPVLKTPV